MTPPVAINRGRILDQLDAIRFPLEGAAAPVPMGLVELRMAIAQGKYDIPAPTLGDQSVEDLVTALRNKGGVVAVDTPPGCQLGVWIAVPNGGRHRYAESKLLDQEGGGTVLRVRKGEKA